MRTRMLAISALAALTVIGAEGLTAAAGNSFTVSNNGMSAYTIDGANNPTLTLTRGQTYTFTVNSFGHPFWITTARGAGDTASNAFSTGVTNNGASPGTLTFAVPVSAPATLFYQCSFHDIMGGTLNIVSGTAAAAPSLGLPALFSLAALLMCVAVFMFGKRAQA